MTSKCLLPSARRLVLWLFAKEETPQVALMGHPANQAVVVLDAEDRVKFEVPLSQQSNAGEVEVRLTGIGADGPFEIQTHR